MSPEDWLNSQGKEDNKSSGMSPEQWLASQKQEDKKPTSTKLGATTDVINRGIVAGTLGAPVDLSAQLLRGFPFNADVGQSPVGGSEWIGKQMERAGVVSPTRRPIAEAVTGMAPGAIGLGTMAAGKLAGKAGNILRKVTGKESKALSEGLRTQIGGSAQDVIRSTEEAQKAPEKTARAVAKAQEQLGKREPIATARQSSREIEADKALSSLSPKNNVLAEDVGAAIQPEAKKNIDALKAERQKTAITELKDPAFIEARAREAKGDFIANNKESAQKLNQVMQEINQQIERTPEPFGSELRKRLSSISGKEVPLSDAEIRAAKVRSSITGEPVPTTKFKPLTTDEAEFMRRFLKSKDLKEGFPGLDAARMQMLGDKLGQAMISYEPRIGSFIKTYREKSAPITRALAGKGRALTDIELQEAENILFAADKQAASRYYLDGSQERAQALLSVSGGKKPAIIDTIKGFFRSELQGMNAKQAETFVQKQQGFLREFPELKKPLMDIVDTKRIAETAGVAADKSAAEAATRLTGQATQAEKAIGSSEKIAEKYRINLSKLETGTKEEVVKNAKSIVNDLRKDQIIDDKKYKDLLVSIEMVEKGITDQTLARKRIAYLAASAVIPVFGVSGYYKLKASLGF